MSGAIVRSKPATVRKEDHTWNANIIINLKTNTVIRRHAVTGTRIARTIITITAVVMTDTATTAVIMITVIVMADTAATAIITVTVIITVIITATIMTISAIITPTTAKGSRSP